MAHLIIFNLHQLYGLHLISLSAILLSDEYYDMLIKNRRIIDGFSLINIEIIILFKIKAWLDLKQRKEAGATIDTKNIRKHKNDIFRLLANVPPTNRISSSKNIKIDVLQFIEEIRFDMPDLKNLGIKQSGFDEMLSLLEDIFISKDNS